MTGTFDAQTNTLFWTTGNPGPDYDGSVRLGLVADADARVARWAAGREGDLFSRAFGRGLEIA